MEGHQRQILGTLTVEEIYKDRAAFSEKVYTCVQIDPHLSLVARVRARALSLTHTQGPRRLLRVGVRPRSISLVGVWMYVCQACDLVHDHVIRARARVCVCVCVCVCMPGT